MGNGEFLVKNVTLQQFSSNDLVKDGNVSLVNLFFKNNYINDLSDLLDGIHDHAKTGTKFLYLCDHDSLLSFDFSIDYWMFLDGKSKRRTTS